MKKNWSTAGPGVPLFFCALTLLCAYSVFIFTYPAVSLFFCALTLFFILHLPCWALILFYCVTLFCCALYPAVPLFYFALTRLCPLFYFRLSGQYLGKIVTEFLTKVQPGRPKFAPLQRTRSCSKTYK